MFNKIKSMLTNGRFNRSKSVEQSTNISPFFNLSGLIGCNTRSYDNTFPNITRIAEAFAEVEPYAVDAKGRRLRTQPPLLKALYNPNQDMSISDFMETLIVMMLVHPFAYILVWHYENGRPVPGGPVTKNNIAGFTFMEDVSVSRVAGTTTYYEGTNQWSKDDVIALSLNVNPYNLGIGYSPSQAIKKWATVDDYIAEYQAGIFRNGAIPAGEMIITAPTVEAYERAVEKLQEHHRGPNNVNNIIYSHRPTSSIGDKPMTAGVEWVPFAQTNKDMTLDSLFNQSNKKIDMNFGVPEEIKGYLQNSNYASAEVADYVFARYVVKPKLKKVLSKLTHELNRITGGLGFALACDYEAPALTDTRKIQADAINTLMGCGFSIESVVEALQLPRSFLKLSPIPVDNSDGLQAIEDNREKPSQLEQSTKSTKYIDDTKAKSIFDTSSLTDPTIKALLDIYVSMILNMVVAGITAESSPEEIGRAISAAEIEIIPDERLDNMRTIILADLYYLLSATESKKAQEYAERLNIISPVKALTPKQREELNMSIQSLVGLLSISPNASIVLTKPITDAVDMLNGLLDKFGLTKVIPSVSDTTKYPDQIHSLLVKFAEQRIDEVRRAVAYVSNGEEAIRLISGLAMSSDYVAERWATSEQHRAEELGNLLAAVENADYVSLMPVKTWHIDPTSEDVCAYCIAIDGETVKATEPFSNGDMVPHYHAHCRCTMSIDFVEEIVRAVKICCPKCGRYMMESTGGSMKNVICANSKCKRHYDFEVRNGKIQSTEVK